MVLPIDSASNPADTTGVPESEGHRSLVPPRCMSTQHPDNVASPFFAKTSELGGEDEIEEAYYAYSHLGCDEQMWDAEGKEVDDFVVKKLMTRYEDFFQQRRLGTDLFLTLRVPNPSVERHEAKILLETLESIPRSFDAIRPFYRDPGAPIFEVILPMTTSARELERVFGYYRDIVIGKAGARLGEDDITVAEWVGDFLPNRINVIPLYEDVQAMLSADTITRQFMAGKNLTYQRVFLARSDPAMNYGIVAAVLMNKIALSRLARLSRELGIPIYPIVGLGSAPFRGNLTPFTVGRVLEQHPSIHTLTVQSSFKYDHNPTTVQHGIQEILQHVPTEPPPFDEERAEDIIRRSARAYAEQVAHLAPVIRRVAQLVPSRRKRKLHVGLFGYGRSIGDVKLPRAIAFTAALYSVGLPPEVLGLGSLSHDDLEFVNEVCPYFMQDIGDAARYLDVKNEFLSESIALPKDLDSYADEDHIAITRKISESLRGTPTDEPIEAIAKAASIRKFLG